jgi:aryl-alcohol dehydrogenase-like predicted oxidoreductase
VSRGFTEWSLGDEDAEPFFQQALELGISFWDTANVYGYGSSEEIVGRALRKYTRRDDIILATKVHFKVHEGPGGSDCPARRSWNRSMPHWPGWIPTMSTCIRSIASTRTHPSQRRWKRCTTSSKPAKLATSELHPCGAWQFSKMQYVAERHGWTKFISMQDQYSLMQREEEREMFGLLADQGVGSIPYTPLAKGRLATPWGEHTARFDVDPVRRRFDIESDRPIVEATQKIIEARGVPMAQVAPAWVLKNPVVTAPILGPTKPHHLPDAAAALDVHLTDDEIEALHEPYGPHLPTAF